MLHVADIMRERDTEKSRGCPIWQAAQIVTPSTSTLAVSSDFLVKSVLLEIYATSQLFGILGKSSSCFSWLLQLVGGTPKSGAPH
jgi:hypothetical protein